MIKKLLLASLLAGSASLATAQEPVEIRLWHMEQPPHRVPVDREAVTITEVREQQHTDCVAGGSHPRRCTDPSLEAQA